MNEEQKKKFKAQQARRRKQCERRPVADMPSIRETAANRDVLAGETNIQREMDYIVGRALENVATCVTLSPLVFFSTETGDAWMLDAVDGLALCLAVGGDPEPVRVFDTAAQTGVEWNREFSIDQDAFVTWNKGSGREMTMLGYPTTAIIDSLNLALNQWNAAKRGR